MATEAWLAAVVLVPLGLAAALLVRPLATVAGRLAPLGALPALLAALAVPEGAGQAEFPGLLLGTVLRLGPITRPLLLLVGLVWLAVSFALFVWVWREGIKRFSAVGA
jgi:ABC-type uncharacterized transport system permease subunit